ncbi:uncharacterized protein LOC105445812 [Strongylocentrotus purpuratus]|uniref:ubiquitinyl hydrolase 1 n=1 Tax=Strongylocentrotus purpuratus TaxID=7668 RepID=A0A7M7N5A4_STRPU|nr:uncharacterized protein LOC105445812 [Strongylocentrotus purpuratus]
MLQRSPGFGLSCKSGDWVRVEVKIEGNLTDVAGIIRYRGELPTKRGIHFGVELEEYRGAGTTDGTFRNHIFFACQQDCGVFVPITRIKKRYLDYNICKRHYRRTPDVVEVDSALGLDDIYAVHQRVHVLTDEGEKEGRVLYCGFPPGAKTEYVGIEFDHPVKPSERNDGTYDGVKLFHPSNLERTILCPKASVLPLANLDQPGILDQHSIDQVHGRAIDPGEVRVKAHVKSSSTGYMPTHAKYGQTSYIGAANRGTTRPKDNTSKTQALATGKHETKSWTTKKFPKSYTESRSRKKETEDRPSADTANTKGHRTIGQDHGRVVSKFTLLDDVLNNVAIRLCGNWKTLAENLGIMNKEITQIVDLNMSSKDCAMDMLRRWREQMSSSRDKLGPLIKACHKSEFHSLANELEQGLDEQRLHHIAGQVHETVWNVLGENLGLERDHLSRLQMEDPHPSQRVYIMLLDWRFMLTFDSDKPLLLAKALGTIGMEELALEVCRGLTGKLLEDLAGSVKDFWKRLGKELQLTTRELQDLQDLRKGDDIFTAYQVLLRWKRRQEPEGDLLGALSAALKICGRDSLANKVVKGECPSLQSIQ